MILKKLAITSTVVYLLLTTSCFSANGSIDSICNERSGNIYREKYITSYNVGDENSLNVRINTSWVHIDHQNTAMIDFVKIAYMTKIKVAVCYSNSDGRIMAIQTNES